MQPVIHLIKKYEPYIFCLVVLANMLPVLLTDTVFSLDGPAHNYNAALVKQFMAGRAGLASDFFEINPVPVPNWTGHLLMSFFQFFMLPVFSEKLLVITLLVLTPFSFRYLVRSFPGAQVMGTYFIFALTYNAFQTLGFYNFLLALVPAFYLTGYMVRHLGRYRSRQYSVMAALLLLVYFSHAFVYLLCLLVMALVIFVHALLTAKSRPGAWLVYLWRLSGPFVLVVLPSAVLFFCFYLTKPDLHPYYLQKSEIFRMLQQNRSLIGFTEDETRYTQPLLQVFVALAFATLVKRSLQVIRTKRPNLTDVFPVLLALMLVLLFVLPEGDGWGGYYTLRTLLFVNLFILLWSAVVHLALWFKAAALVTMFFFHLALIKTYYTQYTQHQPMLAAVTLAGQQVQQNSLVLPINLSGNWLYGHTCARVTAVHGAVTLENYEAGMNYFPLRWKKDLPRPVLKNGEVPAQFITWPVQNTGRVKVIDYIFVIGDLWGQTSEGFGQLQEAVRNDYQEVFNENNCHLFKIKK